MARQSRWARATHGNGGWSRHRNLMMPGNRTRLWVANGRSINLARAGTGTPRSAAANKGATAATTNSACWGQVRNWEAPTRTGTRAARCVAPDRSAAVAAEHLRGPEVAAVARIHGRQMRCHGAVFAARRLDLSGGGLPGEGLPTILLGCPLRSNLPPLRRLHELGARPVFVRGRCQPILLGGDRSNGGVCQRNCVNSEWAALDLGVNARIHCCARWRGEGNCLVIGSAAEKRHHCWPRLQALRHVPCFCDALALPRAIHNPSRGNDVPSLDTAA
mmetsp:Transcript_102972/g.295481  ORF Transcript_102972/g.295481 Transcript_102972/m.295481 type:complete len:275 (-) Transcript_102972:88-912(-)